VAGAGLTKRYRTAKVISLSHKKNSNSTYMKNILMPNVQVLQRVAGANALYAAMFQHQAWHKAPHSGIVKIVLISHA